MNNDIVATIAEADGENADRSWGEFLGLSTPRLAMGALHVLPGGIKYWVNHHTTYYVTNRRAVHMYRFIWLDTTEIPVNAINSISETRGFIEMLTGRGSVLVASGIGARHKVRMGEIDDPGPVAATLRELVP